MSNMPTRQPPSTDTLARLMEAAGPGGFSQDPAVIAPHLREWRDRFVGNTPLLLRPASTDAVARIVTICNQTRTAIVPQGGNTGLVGGQIPNADGTEVLLSLARMNAMRNVDATAGTMTAEAGCILDDIRKRADDHDRLFPLSLASGGSATIGGLLSTNAGGTAVLAYGNMRDLVLGLEAVLPNGQVWNGLRALRKDNTGYDLKNLLVGAEGTLGVITAAVLKLFPRPREMATAILSLESVEAALALLNRLQEAGLFVTSFELMSDTGLDFVLKHIPGTRRPVASAAPWHVLVEISLFDVTAAGQARLELAAATGNKGIRDGAIAQSEAQRTAFWRLRDAMSEAQKPEGGSIKHDVSVPVSSIPAFIAEASAAVRTLIPGARPVPFGHLGDGNIHFNISQPEGAEPSAFLARLPEVNALVHDMVHRYHGSISAEHGLGQAKVDEITRYKSPVEMEAMRAIRRALDPNAIMNPGKVVRV
jgi:FAD/FMN-containing dehydrogenase